MADLLPFNVNSYIRVRLTNKGLAVYLQYEPGILIETEGGADGA